MGSGGGVVDVSAVTVESAAATTATGGNGPHTHMKNIFRASTTVASVSNEQIARIKCMHDKISDGVNWDFNYSCLITIASVVAGLGLATNSSVSVISSMLLSPIMGPVIGMSYGLIIWDLPLIKKSAMNELLSILACIIYGMIIGVAAFWTQMADDWPTAEMNGRATRVTFLTGFPIAFFSGLGVAISVLDDSTSSLVGVAISASLLPPAVNCGILFVMALIDQDKWSDFHGFDNRPEYKNFSQAAIMSLMLTVVNVICVALGATLMFRLKEVLPMKKKVFWDDLKIARRIYQGRATDEDGQFLKANRDRVGDLMHEDCAGEIRSEEDGVVTEEPHHCS